MKRLNVAAVICVRMSSERLPGKPLVSYTQDGKPNLELILNRVLSSRHNVTAVIATSTHGSDDAIADWIRHHPAPSHYDRSGTGYFALYRGELDNVVQRFDGALATHAPNSNWVWRVMADNPLVDINLIDLKFDVLERNNADIFTPLLPEPTYAAQASVSSRAAWDKCAKLSSGSLTQHPLEYCYEHFGEFKTLHDIGPENIYYQNVRTELDTPADLQFFTELYHHCGAYWNDTKRVLTFLSSHPEISKINCDVKVKTSATYLHGHHRARNFICEACRENGIKTVIASKINDGFEIQCHKCGNPRRIYV